MKAEDSFGGGPVLIRVDAGKRVGHMDSFDDQDPAVLLNLTDRL